MQEEISGIGYYKFIEGLEEQFETQKAAIIANLKELMKFLFRPENLMINYTADEEGIGCSNSPYRTLRRYCVRSRSLKIRLYLPRTGTTKGLRLPDRCSMWQRGGNFRKDGYSYTGALQILKLILSYDYLWTNIRVKGGAYGCMSAFKRTGEKLPCILPGSESRQDARRL